MRQCILGGEALGVLGSWPHRFPQMANCLNATFKSADLAKSKLHLSERGTPWSVSVTENSREEGSRQANPFSFLEREHILSELSSQL